MVVSRVLTRVGSGAIFRGPILLGLCLLCCECGNEETKSKDNVSEPKEVDELQQDSNELKDESRISNSEAIKELDPDSTKNPSIESFIDGRYLLQVGAFRTIEAAERMASDLKMMKFPTEVVSENGIYRVRIGHFEGVSDARKVGDRLKMELGLDYWIDNR